MPFSLGLNDITHRLFRIRRILSMLPRYGVSPRRGVTGIVVLASLAGCILCINTFVQASDSASQASAQSAGKNSLDVHVVNSHTKQPLSGVKLALKINRKAGAETTTDNSGHAALPMPDLWPDSAAVLATKEGFVPTRAAWSKFRENPGVPHKYTLELEPGTTIGGSVHDVNGRPIEGVTVLLSLRDGECGDRRWCGDGSFAAITNVTIKTDAAGRWRYDTCPAGRQELYLTVRHPDYVPGDGPAPPIEKLRDQTSVLVLDKGITISGRVVDEDGKPIAGATLSPEAQSDADGRYAIHANQGFLLLIVTASGHSPDLREIDVRPGSPQMDFQLGPPHTIRARILDQDNRPVPNASIQVNSWRGHDYSLRWVGSTDVDGRFMWKDAPSDTVQFFIAAAGGYDNIQHEPLRASPNEQIVRMKKHPIPQYDPHREAAQPKAIGTVRLPDGKPAAAVEVIASGNSMMYINNGHGSGNVAANAKTAADGQFTINTFGDSCILAFIHESGYAEMLAKDLIVSKEVTLRSWGRVEGIVLRGGKPGFNQTVKIEHTWVPLNKSESTKQMPEMLSYSVTAGTDNHGQFIFDRVPPGRAVLGLRQPLGSNRVTSTNRVGIEVSPDKTVRVNLGGAGCPIVGRLIGPEGIDWTRDQFGSILPASPGLPASAAPDERKAYESKQLKTPAFALAPGTDGRFRVEDVPPGKYTLHSTILMMGNRNNRSPAPRNPRSITREFVVPETLGGDSNKAIDLGNLELSAPP